MQEICSKMGGNLKDFLHSELKSIKKEFSDLKQDRPTSHILENSKD